MLSVEWSVRPSGQSVYHDTNLSVLILIGHGNCDQQTWHERSTHKFSAVLCHIQ